jgi:predicted PurR-regulated permease PerM
MTIESVAGIILTILSILVIVGASFRWIIKHYLQDIIHEMKPNSGSSIKDQVTRLEQDIEDLKNQNIKGEEYHEKLDSKIDNLTQIFLEYVSRKN